MKGETKEAKVVEIKENKDGKPESTAGEADKNKSVK